MANVNIYDMADTWNNAGTTFTAIKMNVTDTASNAASLLMDLQVGGTSQFTVSKGGTGTFKQDVNILGSSSYGMFAPGAGYITFKANNSSPGMALASTAYLNVTAVTSIGWTSSATTPNTTPDTTLFRDGAANTLALRNSTNQQTFRAYGTYTDASNYRRVVLTMTTAGVASLSAEGAGTGSSGNVLHISSLPTSNPGPGILWNNAGTPAIGT